ncbi:MAG: fasciclin domain-containing protein [Phycisphaerales bacterium]
MNRVTFGAAVLSGLILATGAAGQCTATAQKCVLDAKGAGNIVEVAEKAGNFKTLVAAIKAADLTSTLAGDGPFTVFAPTDEAFAKLPKGTLEELLKPENKAKLAGILAYHVVSGKVMAADVKSGGVATVNGQRIDIKAEKGAVTVDGAKVVKTDIAAANGVIHVIDTVILPSDKNLVQTAVADGRFKTLAMLIEKAGLADALSGKEIYTVFAPTDEAFAKLPKETLESLLKPEGKETLVSILKYHVVRGRAFSDAVVGANWKGETLQGGKLTSKVVDKKATVGGATVLVTDVDAGNGVIHAIDTVLLPK